MLNSPFLSPGPRGTMRLLSDCRPAVLGASLVPQQVKNPPAMQETLETWIRSLSWEDLLEEENGNLLQCSCLKNPMDSRVTNRWTWLSYRCTCRPTVFKAFPSHSESSFLSKTYMNISSSILLIFTKLLSLFQFLDIPKVQHLCLVHREYVNHYMKPKF